MMELLMKLIRELRTTGGTMLHNRHSGLIIVMVRVQIRLRVFVNIVYHVNVIISATSGPITREEGLLLCTRLILLLLITECWNGLISLIDELVLIGARCALCLHDY